jgi:hypothetical protein
MGSSDENLAGDELDRAHELSWALLDEHISEAEMSELEQLLLTDAKARDSYFRCTQLHGDLASHFTPQDKSSTKSSAKGMPILGFLNSNTPLTGIDSPTADDAR